MTMTLTTATLARRAAAERDRQLVALITGTLARVCPFPATVTVYADPARLRVAAGRTTLLDLDRDDVAVLAGTLGEDATALAIGRRAAAAYRTLAPEVPANVTLGQE